MSGITHTMDTKFEGTVDQLIYKVLAVGNEWSEFTVPHLGLSKPKVLPYSKRSSEGYLQTNVANPRIGTNDSGGVDFAHRLLEVGSFMVHFPIQPSDWQDEFPEFQPSGPQVDLEMNPQIAEVIVATVLNGIEDEISDLDYQGDDTLSSPSLLRFYDGFEKLALADANVIDVANIGVITKGNVLSILESVKKAIPFRLRKKGAKVKIFMNYQDYDLAQEANKETNNDGTILTVAEVPMLEKKYPLIPMTSVPKNHIMATIASTSGDSNLTKGYWFETDKENFILAKESPGDEKWKFLLRAKMGVQYRYGGDIVLYIGS